MKKNIAIIMGGYSSEAAISIQSGNMVFRHLNKDKFDVFRILISREKWVYIDENEQEHPINMADFTATVNGYKIRFDVVFNAIHGHPGEDGTILAYFDLLGIEHSSAPFYQMAVAFNKRDCLSLLKPYGIKTAKSIYLNKGDQISFAAIVKTVGLPCFVKPNRAGSSFGITKVYKEDELTPALEKAFLEDSEILIEQFLDGIEVSVSVITWKGSIKVLPITEIESDNDFFDYKAKYLGESNEITPARISDVQKNKVTEMASKIYKSMGLKGLSRADFIFVGDEPHFIELNMVPGLSEESILPKQAREAGISLSDLFESTIDLN